MTPLRIVDDASVYPNAAIHHLHQGSLLGTIPVRDRLSGELLTLFDRHNTLGVTANRGHYLPGTYVTYRSQFVFQGFPGWPMLMAQWAGLFGLSHVFDAALFAFSMAVVLFGFLLQAAGLRPASFTTATALFASSPLLLFFSKYTTSEAFLLLLVLGVVYFLGEGGAPRTAVAAAAFAVIVVTHISIFLYSPLVLLVAVEAYRSASRRLASFSVASFSALLAGLPLGLFFSPIYAQDIYRGTFKRLGVDDPIRTGLALLAAAYLVGLAVAVAALRRALRTNHEETSGDPWPTSGRGVLVLALRALVLAIGAWIVYRGYQLGWTDHFALHATRGGAWGQRADYSGGGWGALLHLNVDMTMATALVGLPVVLTLAFWRGGEVCRTPRRAVLLTGALLALAVYTFVRVDTPFNYYPSRYFVPVLVPTVMLLFGELMDVFRFRPVVIGALAFGGLVFNAGPDSALYRHPVLDDQMRFVQDVARRVGRNRVLFIRNAKRNDREMLLLLGLPPSQRLEHLRGQRGRHPGDARRRPHRALRAQAPELPRRGGAHARSAFRRARLRNRGADPAEAGATPRLPDRRQGVAATALSTKRLVPAVGIRSSCPRAIRWTSVSTVGRRQKPDRR